VYRLTAPGRRFLPLDLDPLDHFVSLGAIRDPFDRLILSAVRSPKAELISRDAELGSSGLTRVIGS
jgi:PIN domain nuclease of toxin-antitoxin system